MATLIFGALFVVALAGIFMWNQFYPHTELIIGGETFDARVAGTAHRREKGLGGTDGLARNEAMLFVFPVPQRYTFWMKDVDYSIDIIWVKDGKIIDIAPRVAPQFNILESDLPRYTPRLPADRVVEVISGTADRLGLKIGDPIIISED